MSGTRVVLVDDHAGFRRTLRRMLEADGWVVIGEAADGAAAIDLVARERPDLVLLDVGLPDVDGFTVAARLEALGDAPPVILISSREAATYRDRLTAAASGIRGFVVKSDLDGPTLRAVLETGA